MDVHAGLTAFLSLFRMAEDPEKIVATSLDDLIRERFGAHLTDRQVRNVFAQAQWHLVFVRNDARNKKLEPNFYIADALRHPDFKPILDEAQYEKRRAMYDRVTMQVVMGR